MVGNKMRFITARVKIKISFGKFRKLSLLLYSEYKNEEVL